MIRILDNVLKTGESDKLLNSITEDTFPWLLNKELIQYSDYQQYEHYQLYHSLYETERNPKIRSIHYSTFAPIIQSFLSLSKTTGSLYRSKLNLLHNHYLSEKGSNPVHVDLKVAHTSMIYYINDSDGDTVFYENDKEIQRVQPVKNRLVVFEGPLKHCSNHPKNHEHRFVLNTVFITV